MLDLDNYIGEKLFTKFGDKVERRDYYELEKTKDYLKGKGKTSGLMYLVDVDYRHYIDINIYKTGKVKMEFRMDDTALISLSTNTDIKIKLYAFLSLISDYIKLNKNFDKLSSGEIPQDIIRDKKINTLISD